jgi:F-type H+-transporting ATPase subunit b
LVNINWTIFWEVINFLVLMGLLIKYLYNPVTEILDKRSRIIKEDLEEAARRKEEAARIREKYEKQLQQARSRAQEIIEEAEKRGKERAKEIIEAANQEAARIRERNREEIARAKEEALSELRQEVANISLLVAGKFMQEKLEKAEHQRLIEEYIKNLDNARLGGAR